MRREAKLIVLSKTQGGHEFWGTRKARQPLRNTAGLTGLSELEPKQGIVTVPNPEPTGNSSQSLDIPSLNHYRGSRGRSSVDKDLRIPEDGNLNTGQQHALAAMSPDRERGCIKQEHIPQIKRRNDFPLIGTYETTSGIRCLILRASVQERYKQTGKRTLERH